MHSCQNMCSCKLLWEIGMLIAGHQKFVVLADFSVIIDKISLIVGHCKFRCSLAGDPGSSPGNGITFFFFFIFVACPARASAAFLYFSFKRSGVSRRSTAGGTWPRVPTPCLCSATPIITGWIKMVLSDQKTCKTQMLVGIFTG